MLYRFFSLEEGRSFSIPESDYDARWLNDAHLISMSFLSGSDISENHWMSRIRVAFNATVHLISRIGKISQKSPISIATFERVDEEINHAKSLLPEQIQPNSRSKVQAPTSQLVITFLSVQFLFYRQNLQCAPASAERADALVRCLAVAHNTSEYIAFICQVTTLSPETWPPVEAWRSKFISIADNALCLHLWRTILVLCFSGYFNAALICVRASAAVDDMRKINLACGRYLAFFLNRLSEKLFGESGDCRNLENDEEMLTYACGDLLGTSDDFWVWADERPGSKRQATSAEGFHGKSNTSTTAYAGSMAKATSDDRQIWDTVTKSLVNLMNCSAKMQEEESNSNQFDLEMETEPIASGNQTRKPIPIPVQKNDPSRASRISIANII